MSKYEAPRPQSINAADLDWQSRAAYPETPAGQVRWKTLISAERTDSQDLVMGLLEMPPGQALVRHLHPPAETYFIISGKGQVDIQGQIHELSGGSAVFVPPKAVHELRNTGDTTLVVLYHFPVDQIAEVKYEYTPRD